MMQSTNKSTRRFFTISEKKSIAMLRSQSKLKMKAFCEELGITISMLKNWRKNFETPAKVHRREQFIQLAAVKQTITVGDFPFAEIISVSGTELILHQAIYAAFVKALLTGN
jgi:hypothetical protein